MSRRYRVSYCWLCIIWIGFGILSVKAQNIQWFPANYITNANSFNSGVALVKNAKKQCALINYKGKLILPYSDSYSFYGPPLKNGLVSFDNPNYWYLKGVVNFKNKVVLPANYYTISTTKIKGLLKVSRLNSAVNGSLYDIQDTRTGIVTR